jgi:diguanylate cyclase (GGDEF)-like protein
VAIADLDNFKRVNDAYGHDAGDAVLKGFAEILKAHSRSSDICGRIGGEEFLMALTHAKQEDVRVVIERALQRLRDREFSFGGQTIRVTASFGVAGFQGRVAPDFGKLVNQADEALYTAKRTGRNRIEVSALIPS